MIPQTASLLGVRLGWVVVTGRGSDLESDLSRIFVSHSSLDNRQAVALRTWLIAQDPPLANEVFLDTDPDTGMRPGERWKNQLVSATSRCEAVICLLSASWESSPECIGEYRTAENLGKQIMCARLEDGTGQRTGEWQHCDLFIDGLPDSDVEKVPLRGGPAVMFAKKGLHHLREAIRGAGIGAENFVWPPPSAPDRAPYRGWEPFQELDAGVFFGRDAQIVRAMDTLRGMRTTGVDSIFVVLGPSGTGKSSFLRSGLLPRMRREDRRFVLLGIMRPDRRALTGDTGFARAIYEGRRRLGLEQPALGDIEAACGGDLARVRALLTECRQAAAERLPDREVAMPTLVLALDQAEELFSADAGQEAASFLELIAELAEHNPNAEGLGLIVAATIRTDRYEVMQTAPQLIGLTSFVFDDLKPMPPHEFKEVIAGPAVRAAISGRRLNLAPNLVNRLLADAAAGGDALPLLALTLRRLYDRYGETGDLTLDNYEAMGGMHRVVQNTVDEVISGDSERRAEQLMSLRAAFIPWLATINPDNDQPMRRVARWNNLPEASHPLILQFVEKRLLVKDQRDGEVVVEVALESLLRQWDDLAGWLRDQRDDLLAADALERNSAAWDANERNADWLLTGSRLVDAETLSAEEGFSGRLAKTRDYLAASRHSENQRIKREEEQRQAELRNAHERRQTAEIYTADLRRRARVLRFVLAGMAVVVLILAVAVHIFVSTALQNSVDQQIYARVQLLVGTGLLVSDPGKAIEGTTYSDVNAMYIVPHRSIYVGNQEGHTIPLGQPEKDVVSGLLHLSRRTVDHQRILAIRVDKDGTLVLSKDLTPNEKLVRQLDIMSLVIGAIGVAIAAVASTAVTRARRAAKPDAA
jgi:TIR domain/AAA ATPase domain